MSVFIYIGIIIILVVFVVLYHQSFPRRNGVVYKWSKDHGLQFTEYFKLPNERLYLESSDNTSWRRSVAMLICEGQYKGKEVLIRDVATMLGWNYLTAWQTNMTLGQKEFFPKSTEIFIDKKLVMSLKSPNWFQFTPWDVVVKELDRLID